VTFKGKTLPAVKKTWQMVQDKQTAYHKPKDQPFNIVGQVVKATHCHAKEFLMKRKLLWLTRLVLLLMTLKHCFETKLRLLIFLQKVV